MNPAIDIEHLIEHAAEIIKAAEARTMNRFVQFFPDEGNYRRELYPKHLAFFAAGAVHAERVFLAANRVGKSEAGAFEMTAHLTGCYPHWWEGKRFDRPIKAWACGTTNVKTRDIVQSKLIGQLGAVKGEGLGTGMVPLKDILKLAPKSGTANAIDTVWIKHVSGGKSRVTFKSYEQGRAGFEGEEVEAIWLDEECPEDVYTECLLRTMTTNGIVYVTFTPLQGLTPLVLSFLPGGTLPDESKAA